MVVKCKSADDTNCMDKKDFYLSKLVSSNTNFLKRDCYRLLCKAEKNLFIRLIRPIRVPKTKNPSKNEGF